MYFPFKNRYLTNYYVRNVCLFLRKNFGYFIGGGSVIKVPEWLKKYRVRKATLTFYPKKGRTDVLSQKGHTDVLSQKGPTESSKVWKGQLRVSHMQPMLRYTIKTCKFINDKLLQKLLKMTSNISAQSNLFKKLWNVCWCCWGVICSVCSIIFAQRSSNDAGTSLWKTLFFRWCQRKKSGGVKSELLWGHKPVDSYVNPLTIYFLSSENVDQHLWLYWWLSRYAPNVPAK